MSVRVAALLAATLACTYPKLPLLGGDGGPNQDGRPTDGRDPDVAREPDGHLFPDAAKSDGNPDGCPLLSAYSVTFKAGSGSGIGAEGAEDLGSATGVTEILEWQGVISLSPSASVLIQLVSGGGASTPDWPTGDVTPKSGLDLATSTDAAVAIGVDFSDTTGLPEFGYLATTGTLNVTEVAPDLAGSVTGLTFQQYDNLFGGSSASPTPDPDGCTTTMAVIDYDAPLASSGSGSAVASARVGRP